MTFFYSFLIKIMFLVCSGGMHCIVLSKSQQSCALVSKEIEEKVRLQRVSDQHKSRLFGKERIGTRSEKVKEKRRKRLIAQRLSLSLSLCISVTSLRLYEREREKEAGEIDKK